VTKRTDHDRPNILVDSHADPIGASWAKISLETEELAPDGETFFLNFYYLWTNDSDHHAVVNASALCHSAEHASSPPTKAFLTEERAT
jgi:hypothetical protein